MNEKFEELEKRLRAADPLVSETPLSEAIVARAALSEGTKAPLTTRLQRLAFSGSALASVGAFALVVSLALPPAPLIKMAANSGSVAMSQDASRESSSKMIWPGYYEYEYDYSALSTQAGKGKVYQLKLSGSPEDRLKAIAALFGVEGKVSMPEYSTPEYPSYRVGTDQQSVGVNWAGSGNWYYSFWDEDSFKCQTRVIENEDGSTYEACEPVSSPDLMPSESQMRQQAQELFSKTGLTVAAGDIKVNRSEWGGYASAALQIDGVDTAMEWGMNWDVSGRISYAYGHFAEVVDRGQFDTVSEQDAAARIKDGRWYGSPASSHYAVGTAMARDMGSTETITVDPAPVETKPGAGEGSSEGSEGSAPDVIEEGEVIEVEPIEPEIIKLKLTSAKEAMLLIYDQSGGAWLVPGYLLYNDKGWFDSIISLVEGVIELPEPVKFDIMPGVKQD
jgi:hypothetical protein